MNKKSIALIGGLGALAAYAMANKPRKKQAKDDEEKPIEEPVEEGVVIDTPEEWKEYIEEWENYEGKATLGKFYQVQYGDSLFEICREALFGSRALVADPVKRRAIRDLAERIDCSPWNQTVYGREPEFLREDHAKMVNEYWSKLGVSFLPIYQDNRSRVLQGKSPTAAKGNHLPWIWIPMIDLYLFDETGMVSLEGMNYPDTEQGLGHSMIDPPAEILDLGFDEVATKDTAGCIFPEGDFRRDLVPDQRD